jgi:hypothetical protein
MHYPSILVVILGLKQRNVNISSRSEHTSILAFSLTAGDRLTRHTQCA